MSEIDIKSIDGLVNSNKSMKLMYGPFPAFPKAYHSFVKLKTKNENLCDFPKV